LIQRKKIAMTRKKRKYLNPNTYLGTIKGFQGGYLKKIKPLCVISEYYPCQKTGGISTYCYTQIANST
jgi:hypothetical protein